MNAQTYVRRSEWRKRIREARALQAENKWLMGFLCLSEVIVGSVTALEGGWWWALGAACATGLTALVLLCAREIAECERIATFYQHLLDESRWD